MARRLDELPKVHRAFADGELSYSKVRAITRIADADSEDDLLELARHATASQLERMIRIARRVTAEETLESHERSYCLWGWEDDGSLTVRAQLPAEEGAALVEALQSARDALRERRRTQEEVPETALRGSAEPPPLEPSRVRPWPTNAECLAYVAETALSHAESGPKSRRAEVRVHVDAQMTDGECHIEDATSISGATARRVACDAAVVQVTERDGQPISIGRRSRAAPAPIRRALEVRDGGCRYPGCEQRRFTDTHHIKHWAAGGETSVKNMVLLCRRHHTLVHEGGHSVQLTEAGNIGFRDTFGYTIEAAPPLPRPRATPSAPAKPILTGTGEKMDLALCVDAVLAAGSRKARDDLPGDVAV